MTTITNWDMSKKGRVYSCPAGWCAELYSDHIEPSDCTIVVQVIDQRKFRTEIEAETWVRGCVLQQPDKTIHRLCDRVNKFRQVADDIANDLALLPESADYITETLIKRFC